MKLKHLTRPHRGLEHFPVGRLAQAVDFEVNTPSVGWAASETFVLEDSRAGQPVLPIKHQDSM